MKYISKLVYQSKHGFNESGCPRWISCDARVMKNLVYLSTIDTKDGCNFVGQGKEVPAHYSGTKIPAMKLTDPVLGIIYTEVIEFSSACMCTACGAGGGGEELLRDDFQINDPVDGKYEYIVPEGEAVDQIWMKSAINETGAFIGTTDGGDEVMPASPLTLNVWKPLNVQIPGPVTLYFEAFLGLTDVSIFKRVLP